MRYDNRSTNRVTPCCGEEPHAETEMTDMGDHGGHTVYQETVLLWRCLACWAGCDEDDLVDEHEGVA